MRLLVLVATLAITATTALAQPGNTEPTVPYGPPPSGPPVYPPQTYGYPPQGSYVPQTQPPPQVDRPQKSESTARWAAIGTTAAGLGLLYVAGEEDSPALGLTGIAVTLAGPSMGHFYAGEVWRGIGMTALRSGGFALFVAGAVRATTAYDCDFSCADDLESDQEKGERMMLLGGAVVVGSAIYDIYDSARAAQRTNAKRAAQWQVAPTVMSSRGSTLPGVALSGAF